MAQLTIVIPDAIASRVLNAFADAHDYTTETGITKAQFAKAKLIEYIRNTVSQSEARTATEAANQAALTKADTEIQLS